MKVKKSELKRHIRILKRQYFACKTPEQRDCIAAKIYEIDKDRNPKKGGRENEQVRNKNGDRHW